MTWGDIATWGTLPTWGGGPIVLSKQKRTLVIPNETRTVTL